MVSENISNKLPFGDSFWPPFDVSAGIDITELMKFGQVVAGDDDIAKNCFNLKRIINDFQDCFTQIEKVFYSIIYCSNVKAEKSNQSSFCL